jgi:hypothetical protein
MTDRELMQKALEALVRMHSYGDVFRYQNWQANPHEQVSDAITVLRERLEQPTCNCNMRTRLVGDGCEVCNPERAKELAGQEQEPFEYWNAVEGWVKIAEVREQFGSVGCGTIYKTAGEDRVPLYTAPPQRKPLTEEEIADEWERVTGHNISHGDRQEGRAMYISPDEVTEFARAVIAKATGEKE